MNKVIYKSEKVQGFGIIESVKPFNHLFLLVLEGTIVSKFSNLREAENWALDFESRF